MTEIKIGIRKLQRGGGTFVLNIPVFAVRTLGLHAGDTMFVSLTDDGAIRIEKQDEIPMIGDALARPAPIMGRHQTHCGVDADGNQP